MVEQYLVEMATIATLQQGLGYILVIHTNDHEPAHIHLYKSAGDVATESYYTRVLIPEILPTTVDDIKTYSNDAELTAKEKKILLNWFRSPSRKNKNITNFDVANLIWDTYQNPTYR